MKYFLLLLVVFGIAETTRAQTTVDKSVAVKSGQKVAMTFKYPELISIKTWDKNEIQISANVSINGGSNDEAFEIIIDEGETLNISSRIKDYENLPRRVVIRSQGRDYFFETDDLSSEEIQKFREENGGSGFDYMSQGVIVDIVLEITVPKNISLEVDATFGLVEIEGFENELRIDARHGGIDASVNANSDSPMRVNTKFGELYSNLDAEFSSDSDEGIGKWAVFESASVNETEGGLLQSFRSEFGNVYLRKR